jgi:uncharacterized protein YraI
MKRQLTLLTLVVVFILSISGNVAAQDNLLLNPGFEDERTSGVAVDPDSPNISFNAPIAWGGNVPPPDRPGADYPVGFPHRVYKRSGTFGFQMGRGGALYRAGLFQDVYNIQAGLEVEMSAFVYIEGDGARTRVGVNPVGGNNPFDPSVVWSDWEDDSNTWKEIRVRATAGGTGVTVFLYAEANQPANPSFAYWDDAALRVVGGAPVALPPAPSTDPNAPPAVPGAPGSPPAAQQPAAPPQPQPGDLINVVVPFGNLNVRTGAGTRFPVIGMISAPNGYPLINTVENWHEINYNGQIGFVFAPLAEVQQRVYQGAPAAPATSTGTTPAGTTATTTTDPAQPPAAQPAAPSLPPNTGVIIIADQGSIAVFAGPGEAFGRIGELPGGSFLHVTGRNVSGWLRVTFNDQVGWVMARFGLVQGDQGAVPLVQ